MLSSVTRAPLDRVLWDLAMPDAGHVRWAQPDLIVLWFLLRWMTRGQVRPCF